MPSLKAWALAIKRDTLALYLATRDPRTPWPAKALAIIVVAYALSPIDLIPDFIPVLGYLDDLIILPIGIWASVKLVPPSLMVELRSRAAALAERPVNKWAAAVIVCIWIAAAASLGHWLYTVLRA